MDPLQVPLERPEKRSLSIAGHRTSVALEPSFWAALERLAADRGLALGRLIEAVDLARARQPEVSLASALRLAALQFTARGLAGPGDFAGPGGGGQGEDTAVAAGPASAGPASPGVGTISRS